MKVNNKISEYYLKNILNNTEFKGKSAQRIKLDEDI